MARFAFSQMLAPPAPRIPPGHVLPRQEALRQMETAGNPSITWLGHAGFILRTGGKVIVTDPFLGKVAGPFGIGPRRYAPAPMTGAELPRADTLLISHNHYDHLDAPTMRAYPYKDSTQVIVPLGLGGFFTRRGYGRVLECDWWDEWHLDGLKIIALPAVHFSSRGLHDRNRTLWAGYGIETTQGRIWFCGDTARSPVFDEIGHRAGPFDLALVPIGAYEPRSIMESVHVTPEEAVEIVRQAGARRAIGMHWGTIALTPEDPFEAPDRFRGAAEAQGLGRENALTMRIGETLALDQLLTG